MGVVFGSILLGFVILVGYKCKKRNDEQLTYDDLEMETIENKSFVQESIV